MFWSNQSGYVKLVIQINGSTLIHVLVMLSTEEGKKKQIIIDVTFRMLHRPDILMSVILRINSRTLTFHTFVIDCRSKSEKRRRRKWKYSITFFCSAMAMAMAWNIKMIVSGSQLDRDSVAVTLLIKLVQMQITLWYRY